MTADQPPVHNWTQNFNRLWWPLIVLAFASTCVIGTVGSIASVVCALLCLPMIADAQVRRELAGQWDILVFPIFFLALGIVFALSADQLSDMAFWFNFTSLPLSALVFVLARRHSGGKWPLIIISLAFIGAALGTLFGVVQTMAGLHDRARGLFNNPNMYGHIILILGFMTVPGLFMSKSPWRWLFLAGPILGIMGAVLSGSRGTLLAVPPAAVLALGYALTQPNARRWVFGFFAIAFVAIGIWFIYFAQFDGVPARLTRMFATMSEVLQTGESSELGTQARLDTYVGAWNAFLRSPIIGHGWAGALAATLATVESERIVEHSLSFRHLHSDFLGFAAGAGLVGLVGYFAMLAAPFYSLRHRDALFWHRAYLASLLVSTYVIYGVLDAMFGFDTGISTFAFMTAILAGTFTGPQQTVDQPAA